MKSVTLALALLLSTNGAVAQSNDGERHLMAALQTLHDLAPHTTEAQKAAAIGVIASAGAMTITAGFAIGETLAQRLAPSMADQMKQLRTGSASTSLVVLMATGAVIVAAGFVESSRVRTLLASGNPRVWSESADALAYFLDLSLNDQFAIARTDPEFSEQLIAAADAFTFLNNGLTTATSRR